MARIITIALIGFSESEIKREDLTIVFKKHTDFSSLSDFKNFSGIIFKGYDNKVFPADRYPIEKFAMSLGLKIGLAYSPSDVARLLDTWSKKITDLPILAEENQPLLEFVREVLKTKRKEGSGRRLSSEVFNLVQKEGRFQYVSRLLVEQMVNYGKEKVPMGRKPHRKSPPAI